MQKKLRNADRVEKFISSIDAYEPSELIEHADQFRLFARYMSRAIDGRYLERHPADELLPALEGLMKSCLSRAKDDVVVRLSVDEDSEGSRGVLSSCLADQPFHFSTIRLSLEQLGLKSHRFVHGGVPIRRDLAGEVSAIGAKDGENESFVWIEVELPQDAAPIEEIEKKVAARLLASQAAVNDFEAIQSTVGRLADNMERLAKERPDYRETFESNAKFIRWLLDEHFVFLGLRYLAGKDGVAEEFESYGIGRFDDWRGVDLGDAESAVLDTQGIPPYLWIRKSRKESWTYRAGRNDHILVQHFDDEGRPSGLVVLEGLFSYQAMAEAKTSIPRLSDSIHGVFRELQATKGSHRYRTIRNAFNSLPLDYLFAMERADLRSLIEQLIEIDSDNRLQLHVTNDEAQQYAFVFVAMPRSHYNDELRSDVKRLLREAFRATSIDDGVYAGDVQSVTMHFFLTGAAAFNDEDVDKLREQIENLASPWGDRLLGVLTDTNGDADARRLHADYAEAFPRRYQEETAVSRTVTDIEFLESIDQGGFDCDLYQEKSDKPLGVTRLRLFQNDHIILSNVLPILDNLGLIVIDEFPTTVQVRGKAAKQISTFRLGGVQHMNIDLQTRRNRLSSAIKAVVSGAMSNDPLNRMLLRADIPWTYVVLVRSLQHYARQIRFGYSMKSIHDVLLKNADLVRTMTELFRAKFDPDIPGLRANEVCSKRLELIARTERALSTQLDNVLDLTSDQVLRMFTRLIDATVRTNFYSRNPMLDKRLVFKFDPSELEEAPEPKPFREIYVHHPDVLGVHLRGGKVARGGLRWSDRLLDYRTEVHGLMATQNLKNVLIVPRGAKGGFVLRRESEDTVDRRQFADEMYKEFIGGLLDVTDNLLDGEIVPPERVMRYDQDDHYLVVAADKGTAHLSDTANEVAKKRGFWLGDAFASGGSQGYDHKKEAITARGAWACVRRHFREMGLDPEKDTISAVGIGDMSGDVFGNGMLRSKTMKVIAAFDHRHIFIDPNPDPQKSYEARLKLFNAGRTTWEDYPKSALSEGAGIYPRGAKAVTISVEAQSALGLASTGPFSGRELVKAVLCASVDLWWNGGIGTYIKASSENDREVGDPTNDSVRVSASSIRSKVIGEGGNLGITPTGRIELAEAGVRLNTDAVDNSGGVDMSDHEVNLKILFAGLIADGKLDTEERNRIMEAIKEEVGERVLRNNWHQSRMISLDEIRSKSDPARFYRAVMFLSERVPFDRRELHLPGERLIQQRTAQHRGLYRPELATLASSAKLDLRQQLDRSDFFDLGVLEDYLLNYFPAAILERFKDQLSLHPLALNIAQTMIVNQVLCDAGSTWIAETSLRTGRTTEDILRAYLQATSLVDANRLKREVDAIELDIDCNTEYRLRLWIEDAVEETCTWLLRRGDSVPAGFGEAFSNGLRAWPKLLDRETGGALAQKVVELGMNNVPKKLAEELVLLSKVGDSLDVALLATRYEEDVVRAAQAFVMIGEESGLSRIMELALESNEDSTYDRPARFALKDQTRNQQVELAAYILGKEPELKNLSADSKIFLDALNADLKPLIPRARELANLVIVQDRIRRRLMSKP